MEVRPGSVVPPRDEIYIDLAIRSRLGGTDERNLDWFAHSEGIEEDPLSRSPKVLAKRPRGVMPSRVDCRLTSLSTMDFEDLKIGPWSFGKRSWGWCHGIQSRLTCQLHSRFLKTSSDGSKVLSWRIHSGMTCSFKMDFEEFLSESSKVWTKGLGLGVRLTCQFRIDFES